MKRITIVLGIGLVGIIVLLECAASRRRNNRTIHYSNPEHDEVWWGN